MIIYVNNENDYGQLLFWLKFIILKGQITWSDICLKRNNAKWLTLIESENIIWYFSQAPLPRRHHIIECRVYVAWDTPGK